MTTQHTQGELYVCHEREDRENPRATGRFAIHENKSQGREIAVITLTGYCVGAEKSPQDWANLFAAAPDLLKALELALAYCPSDTAAFGLANKAIQKAGGV